MSVSRKRARVPVITDWNRGRTFTYTGLGTVANEQIYSRRVGDSLEVRGSAQCGTVAASVADIQMPGNLRIDAAKLYTVSVIAFVGTYFSITTGASADIYPAGGRSGVLAYDPASPSQLFFVTQAGADVWTKQNGSTLFANSQYFSLWFSIPIQQWRAK